MAHRVTAVGQTTTLHDRKVRAGQRLVIGLPHPHVDDDLRALVKEIGPAGFILFRRNVEEPAQVRELVRELKSLVDPHHPALVSIDQEGGRVQRVRAPATEWPPMRTVGRAGDHTAAVATALATELAAMGIDLDYAPVADVDSNPDNPVIGDRAFSHDPAEVARHVTTFVQAMQARGVIACAKHFPGHGDTRLDSHTHLPVVEEEIPRLRTRELVPFEAAVRAGVGAVMTAHVVFPAWDEDLPATLSPRILPTELRGRLGFGGVVFSDDLEMKAVADRWDVPTIVRLATQATVDVLLCCASPELQIAAYTALVQQQEDEPALHRATEDAVKRVHALRERFLRDRPPQPDLSVVGAPDHRVLAELVRQRGG
ncbi:MAG: beta-N-acetylhexosaminidase [Alphaproteobacteria bacterium]|nr:beta-N-acetylhexosaminidase [Alphaproteobacteria bacterium]